MKLYQTIILLAILLPNVNKTFAQSGSPASYSQIGISPRTIGIGNAYTAGGAEGIFTFHNPAMTASTSGGQVDFSGATMQFGRSLATLQVAFPLPPSAGLALDIAYAGVSGFDGRTQSGYHTEEFNTHDMQLGASFGLQVSTRFSLGTRISYRTMRYTLSGLDTPSSIGVDIGFLFRFNDRTSIGFSVQDLIGEFVWDTSEYYGTTGSRQTTDKMPIRLKAGLWHQLNTPLPLNLYAEFENRILRSEEVYAITAYTGSRPTIQQRREEISFAKQFIRLGVSSALHERITARVGWQSDSDESSYNAQRFSGGFSISLPFDLYAPEIDYAILREPGGVSWMHMFAIRLNLTNR